MFIAQAVRSETCRSHSRGPEAKPYPTNASQKGQIFVGKLQQAKCLPLSDKENCSLSGHSFQNGNIPFHLNLMILC